MFGHHWIKWDQGQVIAERVNMHASRGGGGVGIGVCTYPPPPLENHKAIQFLSNTGQVPLENLEASKPVFNV